MNNEDRIKAAKQTLAYYTGENQSTVLKPPCSNINTAWEEQVNIAKRLIEDNNHKIQMTRNKLRALGYTIIKDKYNNNRWAPHAFRGYNIVTGDIDTDNFSYIYIDSDNITELLLNQRNLTEFIQHAALNISYMSIKYRLPWSNAVLIDFIQKYLEYILREMTFIDTHRIGIKTYCEYNEQYMPTLAELEAQVNNILYDEEPEKIKDVTYKVYETLCNTPGLIVADEINKYS